MAGGMAVGLTPANTGNTSTNGSPTYFLPGTNVPDPRYSKKKAAYDQELSATQKRNADLDRERQNFYHAAGNNANYEMSFTDPRTGFSLNYPGGGGGARRSGSGAGGSGVSFDEAVVKAKPHLPARPRPAVLPERIAPPPRTDFEAANAAEFARAKDRIGMTGQGAVRSLQSLMTRRGLAGSGIEGAELGDLVGGLRGQLGDVIRDQTITNVNRNAQLDDRDFAALLGQRSDDLGFEVSTRGQDISAEGQRASALPALISLAMRSGSGTIY